MRIRLFAGLCVLLCSNLASAFEITPVGTFQYSTIYNPPSTTGGTGWGYGLMLGQYVHSDVEIESGVLYFTRSENMGNPTSLTSTFNYLQVPVLIRVRPKNSHCTFGVGGYYAHGIGNIQDQATDASSTYVSYEQMQVSREDFGVLAALGFRWEFAHALAFYSDARFAYGMKNINLAPGGQTEQWRDYLQFLVGASLLIH